MRIASSFLFLALFTIALQSQPCNYLAYEPFDYTGSQPLHGLNGGAGWLQPWEIQSGNTNVPGYQTAAGAASLTYSNLQTIGRQATGGLDYLTAGRLLDYEDGGSFDAYVAQYTNAIGTEYNTTLWASVLLRKDDNNSEPIAMTLHESIATWCESCSNNRVSIGYFGASSEVGGQKRWSLGVGSAVFPTSVPVVVGTTAFIVLRLDFAATGTTVHVYVNPTSLGNNIPSSPTLTTNAGFNVEIRSAAVYLGENPGSGAIDELRIGASYPCVAPDPSIAINLSPVAQFTTAPLSGTAPLNINFNGSASYDPEGLPLTYEWNFGDGTPIATGATVSHTFTALGKLNVTLKVRDNLGLAHITSQEITVYNSNGAFPCQTHFTVPRMPDCNANNGQIVVNNAPASFELYSSSLAILPKTNGNEYHDLAPGTYLFVGGNGSGGCLDSFQLHMRRDSSTCSGWIPDPCAMRIGTNMSAFVDWGVERPMKNLFKHIRPDIITYTPSCFCWDLGVADQITLDANGYPTHIPQTTSEGSNTMVRYIISSESTDGTNLQAGQDYVLLYDGEGALEIGGGANVSASAPGRIAFSITNNMSNYMVNITSSTLGNPVRNIHLLRASDEFADLNENPFYNGFLEKIAPFQALRFMDWGLTNQNPSVNWSERGKLDFFTYGTNAGAPYEIMIQLANQLDKDVWICVPHAASADYITQMANLFKNTLEPDRKVFLEYSNEVWNWIFPQAIYNEENRPSNLNYGRAYAEKAKNAFQIWHSVWGSEKNRVKRVLGMQVTYNFLNEQILSQLNETEWDYGSPTFYFGLDHGPTGNPVLNASSTPTDIVENARNYWLNGYKSSYKADYNQVHLFGKEIVNYEGGQHFVGNVFGITYPYQQAMYDAQYTNEIAQLYNDVLDTTRAWGSRLAANFSLATPQENIYGSWGVLNDIDVAEPFLTTAPKYQALLDNMPPTYCLTALAVDAIDFWGQPVGQINEIYWSTAAEYNSHSFEVERSEDGTKFIKIGRLDAAGNSSTFKKYQFNDTEPPVIAYYRYKQIDRNGKFVYSEIIRIERENPSGLWISPNPVYGDLNFTVLPNASGSSAISIVDMVGKVVYSATVEVQKGIDNPIQIPVEAIPQGAYLLVFTNASSQSIARFVIGQ